MFLPAFSVTEAYFSFEVRTVVGEIDADKNTAVEHD